MYHKLIAEHNMHDRITIHPFTDNVQQYYSDAQIYVLSSRWEGFGLVLVEAMAHGLPIVSSDIPTSKEIMGDFGIYFKNGDIEELAKALEESTHIAWQQLSEQAIHIANSFDIRNIIGKWKNIIGA
jgi:glycosyltransferase involved in cell wall biosynthesis